MATALVEETVLPPEEPREQAQVIALRDELSKTGDGSAKLVGPDGTQIDLPADLYRVLRDITGALAQGLAVTVAPHNTVLTTQEAADILGITRPTLVKLLDEDAIPYARPGRHRRVLLRDVLAYAEQRRTRRGQALSRMVDEGEAAGLYELTADPRPTR